MRSMPPVGGRMRWGMVGRQEGAVPSFARDEIESAFAHYCQLRERASASGDWSIWAGQFTADARG